MPDFFTAGLLAAILPKMRLIFLGVVLGTIFGSIPGLMTVMATGLCLPITYGMSPAVGGLIVAILPQIPGTPASIPTTFAGGPIMKRGESEGPGRGDRLFRHRNDPGADRHACIGRDDDGHLFGAGRHVRHRRGHQGSRGRTRGQQHQDHGPIMKGVKGFSMKEFFEQIPNALWFACDRHPCLSRRPLVIQHAQEVRQGYAGRRTCRRGIWTCWWTGPRSPAARHGSRPSRALNGAGAGLARPAMCWSWIAARMPARRRLA